MAYRPLSQESASDKPPKVPTSRIHRSTYVVWLVLFYAALVLSSWTITCIITYHPINGKHYDAWILPSKVYPWASETKDLQKMYAQNEEWYRAARVIQSIAAVLTIPLTSAVCASAAVVYLQHCTKGQPPTFTLRQMTVLADKGWTNIGTYYYLITGRWSRYKSVFLLWAVLLHVLGGIISPAQQLFLSSTTIKTPTIPSSLDNFVDIPDMFKEEPPTSDTTVILTRNSLASTSADDTSSQLWSGNDSHLESRTWAHLSEQSDPFFAQLTKDYNTGVIQQFLPRINSTAHYEGITEDLFPAHCDTIPGALSISHSPPPLITTTDLSWAIHVCMPSDQRMSPRKNTRSQQNFTEHLYLNVSLSPDLRISADRSQAEDFPAPFSEYFRVTVETTAGYFELPNYMNGQKAGPLLKQDPNLECGNACYSQGGAI